MPMYSEAHYRSNLSTKQTKRENEASHTPVDVVGLVGAQSIESKPAMSDDTLTIAGQDWS